MVHHLKVLVTNPLLNVPLGPREVIISHKHLNLKNDDILEKFFFDLMSLHHQSINKMRADKPGSPGHQDSLLVLVGAELYLGEGFPLSQFVLQRLEFGLQSSNDHVGLCKLSFASRCFDECSHFLRILMIK